MKLLKILPLFILSLSSLHSLAGQTLSAAQQAQLDSLPPALRAQALDELRKYQSQGQGSSRQNQPLENPNVVIPDGEQTEEDGKSNKPKALTAEQIKTLEETGMFTEEEIAMLTEEARKAKDLAEGEEVSEEKEVDQDLEFYGYDLFSGTPTTFAPATEIPVPVDYILGPGDQVRIQFFGKENSSYDLYVSRDGVLQIPQLGPVAVVGQSFNELKNSISERVDDQMIGNQVFVSMGELRSIRVFMLGDVKRPGSYTVSSLSTMANALFVSGGIKPIGSLRKIQLKRSGEVVTTLDLYDYLLNGDTSGDARVQPGDVIFVPPVGKRVGVAGEVQRPAIYELAKDETVEDVLQMAGGLTAEAYPSLSQIERITSEGLKRLVDVDLSQTTNLEFPVTNGDTVRIYSSLDRVENFVRLEGAVERPGDYEWKQGQHVSDIITKVEQLLPVADLDYSLVVSRNPITGQLTTRSFSLEQLFLGNNEEHDLLLEPKDRIVIFDGTVEEREGLQMIVDRLRAQSTSHEPQKIVSVKGRVRHPGEYPLDREMNLSALIRAAGGFTEDAYTLEAELIRYQDNNKTIRDSLLIPVSLSDSSNRISDLSLQSYDQLNIKRIPEWTEQETIEISGEVRFPGVYVIERGETLSRIIERAGGLTSLAHPQSAVFLRESLRESEEANLLKLRERLASDIAAAKLQRDNVSLDGINTAEALLDQLETTEAVGRLVINLPAILEGSESVNVRDGDSLIVPQKPQAVTIIGSVNYPTSHLFQGGLSHKDYISLSGGLTRKADKKQIYVVRSNGRVVTDNHSRFFPKGSITIEAGDMIVVPIDVDRIAPLKLWASTSQIFYQIALGAAAINSF